MADNKFFNLFNDIDDKYIDEAQHVSSEPVYVEYTAGISKKWSIPMAIAGAAACLALVFGVAKIRSDIRARIPDDSSVISGDYTSSTFTDEDGNSFMLKGTPLAAEELADFTYEDTLNICREKYAEDEELTAVLESIGNPEVVELYYRARTLADIVAREETAGKAAFSERIRSKSDAAELTVLRDTMSIYSHWYPIYTKGQILRETGYSYDSFYNALCEVFDEQIVSIMLSCYPYFYDYNGQLFCTDITAGASSSRIHTEYKLKDNSDFKAAFTTVNYYVPFETIRQGGELTYDPAKKNGYKTTEIENVFIKVNGKWHAYEVCMLGDYSSNSGRVYETETLTESAGSWIRLYGTPFFESELENLDFGEMNEYYWEMLGEDKALTELFDSLGSSEKRNMIGLYCRARMLADFIGGYEITAGLVPSAKAAGRGNLAYIDTFYDSQLFWSGYTYEETGYKYDALYNELRLTFTDEALEKMLECYPYIYELNNELYCDYSKFKVSGAPDIIHTEYELVTNSDTEIVFNTVNYYSGETDVYDPAKKDSYAFAKISNRIARTSIGWQVTEISIYGEKSSVGKEVSFFYPQEERRDEKLVTNGGDTLRLTGTPKDYYELAEFDYTGKYETLKDNATVYKLDNESELFDFLDGLGNPEAADVYIRATALTDGFGGCGYVNFREDHAYLGLGDRLYIETGYTTESFAKAMREVFTVEAAQTVPANVGVFYNYGGELWQMERLVGGTVMLINEYELVKNTDSEIEFNTNVYRALDRVPEKTAENRLAVIKNRLVNTESGWRVDEMCMWGRQSSAEPWVTSDLPLDETRELLGIIKDYAEFYCAMQGDIVADVNQPLRNTSFYKVIEGPVHTEAELNAVLDGMLTEDGKQQFKKDLLDRCYRISDDGDLYVKSGALTYPNGEYMDILYLNVMKSTEEIMHVYATSYGAKENWGLGEDVSYFETIELIKTENGWRINDCGELAAELFGHYDEAICGVLTLPLE